MMMTDDDLEDIKYASYTLDLSNINPSLVHQKIYEQSYAIYNYDSDFLCHDDRNHGQYRSVVVSYPDLRTILAFSPPKSLSYGTFIEKYGETDHPHIVCSDYVEGVMINLFYDARNKGWQIATKSGIGGYYHYYPTVLNHPSFIRKPVRKMLFREMFMETLGLLPPKGLSFAGMEWFANLDQRYSYSFVLQHPENKITVEVERAKLFLVAVYQKDGMRMIQIPPHVYESWSLFLNSASRVEFPPKHDGNHDVLMRQYCSPHTKNRNRGLVFWNWSTGDRCILENPCYKELKRAMNVNPSLHYQYLCVSRINKVADFYRYFPLYKKQCSQMGDLETKFVDDLHKTYLNVYVYKNIMLDTVSAKYRNHVEILHKIYYLPFLGSNALKPKITKQVVRNYLHTLEPRELMYALYYERRLLC
jgi:hypothetical protein